MSSVQQVRIKICGISDVETAMGAAALGADAIGMVFAPSKRRVTPETARAISLSLPPFVSRVGVFVNAALQEVMEIADFCQLDAVQLHGNEPPDYCRSLRQRVIKAFQMREGTMDNINDYPVDGILLDSYVTGTHGGTGIAFDWTVIQRLNVHRPLILAGGLNADNVSKAIEIAGPYAVDVSSGIETNGTKDLDKIENFINKVKSARRKIHAAG